MLFRLLVVALSAGAAYGADVTVVVGAADSPTGSEFAARVAPLDLATRERAIIAEVKRGNVPAFWRKFVEVKVANSDAVAVFRVAPDYFAIGTDDDYFL